MKCVETTLPGVFTIEPTIHTDERGAFIEVYNAATFIKAMKISPKFVQDNRSRSRKGVLRGLHYQLGRPQAKLVSVLAGEIFDVAVDVRRGSPTFGEWVGVRLSGDNMQMLFIPPGFAHGFYALSDTVELLYKCTALYSLANERGIAWNDQSIGIEWPIDVEPILSEKDAMHGLLNDKADVDLPTALPSWHKTKLRM